MAILLATLFFRNRQLTALWAYEQASCAIGLLRADTFTAIVAIGVA